MTRQRLRFYGLVVVVAGVVAAAWWLTPRDAPVIHVRWKEGVSEDIRRTREAELGLRTIDARERNTWRYAVEDTSPAAVEALVKHPDVDDTHYVDRARFVIDPEAPRARALLAESDERKRSVLRRRLQNAGPWPFVATVMLATWVVNVLRSKSRRTR